MSELADLERRITDALDRIGTGLEKMTAPAPAPEAADSGEMAALSEALDAEKTANAQLEERLKTLRAQSEARAKESEDEVGALKAAASETEVQLAKAQQDLRASESAQTDGAALKAMEDELQGLRKVRNADRAELDGILAGLKPLMEDQTNA